MWYNRDKTRGGTPDYVKNICDNCGRYHHESNCPRGENP